MRLTVPEPKVSLYEEGFKEDDPLVRKGAGNKLSQLVEHFDDPLVIALDGAWGSGKSHFLKCWVGEHWLNANYATQTIYFDAFAHDFLDDPLIALTGAISERFDKAKDTNAQRIWMQAKQVAPAIGRALLRAGVSVATAGAIARADDLADAAIKKVGDELEGAVADFWMKESSKRVAMTSFQNALVNLTKPTSAGKPTRKLVIVIDELDRCRPDFALSLLEVIKHFFAVDGVHFVLGVNQAELQNSVRARYGQGVDAWTYLQKFISLRMSLPNKVHHRDVLEAYYDWAAKEIELPLEIYAAAREVLLFHSLRRPVTLRGVQQYLSALMLLPKSTATLSRGYMMPILFGVLYKCFEPEMYVKFTRATLMLNDLEGQLDGSNQWKAIWTEILDPTQHSETTKALASNLFGIGHLRDREDFLAYITSEYLENLSSINFT